MFFPPKTIEAHYTAFYRLAEQTGVSADTDVKRRVAFFHLAHKFDCGVIELQNTFQFLATVDPVQLVPLQVGGKKQQARHLAEARSAHKEGHDQYGVLRSRIEHAIQAARAGQTGVINFSNHLHHVITEVLHEFIYKDPAEVGGPVSIQIIYNDKSKGEPFPLYCLPRRAVDDLAGLNSSHILRVALMSPRHLGMSSTSEVARICNRSTSGLHTLADADTLCYRLTCQQLQETRCEGGLKFHLYQTTFQPAVIGFYRALLHELQYRAVSPASLEVTPYYFSRKIGYWSGSSWN